MRVVRIVINNDATKQDVDKNIDALERAIEGNPLSSDSQLHLDTKSILDAIREQLPDKRWQV